MCIRDRLSTNYKNQIVDICCRIISTDGEVTLSERIWMTKLCDSDEYAKLIVGSMLGSDFIDDIL